MCFDKPLFAFACIIIPVVEKVSVHKAITSNSRETCAACGWTCDELVNWSSGLSIYLYITISICLCNYAGSWDGINS